MQYREELITAASSMLEENKSRKSQLLNKIQTHAISQIKDGYTSFRISKLRRDEEKYLAEWAEMTNAKVHVIRFRCFADEKKYQVRQFLIDLRGSIKIDYDLEGKTLIL